MTSSRWSDADLIAHDFDVAGRPDQDPTVSRDRPPEGARLTFTRAYDITPPSGIPGRLERQPYVWCALCQEPTHWIGWEAEVADTNPPIRLLVGQHCARKKGGDMTKIAANEFDARRKRADALRARKAVLLVADPVRRALETWSTSDGVAAVDAWRSLLRTHASATFSALEKAARAAPPTLQIEVQIRDHAAEAARDRRRGQGSDEPILRTDYQTLGPLVGAALYTGASPSLRLRLLIEKLSTAITCLARPSEPTSTRDLQAALKVLREVADGARELERTFSGSERGLQDEAIDLLLQWTNRLPQQGVQRSRLSRRGDHLVLTTDWNRPVTLKIPQADPIKLPGEITALEAALLGQTLADRPLESS